MNGKPPSASHDPETPRERRGTQGPNGPVHKPGDEPRRPRPLPLLFVLLLLVLGIMLVSSQLSGVPEITYGEFKRLLDIPPGKNPLLSVTLVEGEEIRGTLDTQLARQQGIVREGGPVAKFRVVIAGEELEPKLHEKIYAIVGDKYTHQKPQTGFWPLIVSFLPWLLIFLFLWFFLFRRMGAGGGPGAGVFSFGKARARMHSKETVHTTFSDVAGVDEAKDEVLEFIEFLKNPDKFRRVGGRIPRGLLLVGPPGCGKTLLAKAIAGEAGVPFFAISGSDFVEMFVGVGASRVRDLFKQAKDSSPCIIFLDEIDAVGRRRGTGLGGGHDEREQTLNAILVEMDGFETDTSIIVIAATNRPDVLDPALLRPGRFDRQVRIDPPDVKGRELILKVHTRKVKLGPDVKLSRIARGTPGFSGAELESLVNEAAIATVMAGRDLINHDDLEEARDKVLWGRQKRSRAADQKELEVTAYHEAGHAFLQHVLPESDPIHKVTIVPRGVFGGATMALPERDRHMISEVRARTQLAVFFGGRTAEKLFFDQVTTGASSDIKQATDLARRMVCEWGMSEAVGPLSFADSEEHMFLGREIARTIHHSEATAQTIDAAIRGLIDDAEGLAKERIQAKRDTVEALAKALLTYETLAGDEVVCVLEGRDLGALRAEKEAAAKQAETQTAGRAPKAEPQAVADDSGSPGLPRPRLLDDAAPA